VTVAKSFVCTSANSHAAGTCSLDNLTATFNAKPEVDDGASHQQTNPSTTKQTPSREADAKLTERSVQNWNASEVMHQTTASGITYKAAGGLFGTPKKLVK